MSLRPSTARSPRGLLGRHVLRRAERETRLRDSRTAGVGDRQRDAEIGDERLSLVKQDVLGLEVAMDDTVAVRVIESVGHSDANAHCLGDR